MWYIRTSNFPILLCLLTFVGAQIRKDYFLDSNVVDDPKILHQKWDTMEKRMKEFIQNTMKSYLPTVMEMSNSLNISSECTRDVVKVTSGLRNLKLWAVKFLDASAKGIDGMVQESFTSLGNFDECLNNVVIDERVGKNKGKVMFRGKYCQVQVKPYLPPKPKGLTMNTTIAPLTKYMQKDTIVGYLAKNAQFMYFGSVNFAVCVPSDCTVNDINQILAQASEYSGSLITVQDCQVKEEAKFTPMSIVVITIYSFTGFLVLIGTLIDINGYYKKMECKSTCLQILLSFSFVKNFKKLINTSSSSRNFAFLNGMKTVTIFWIILSHSYLALAFTMHDTAKVLGIVTELSYQVVLNGSIGVDTFFVITGFLSAFAFTNWVIIDKKPFNVIMYIVHRVWRLLPAYFFVLIFIFIMPLIGSGPDFHRLLNIPLKSCEKNWWANLLFISNVYDVDNECFVQGWYVSLDMQFHIAALLILLPLAKCPKLGITLGVVTMIASMVGSWLTIYLNDMMPVYGFTIDYDMLNSMNQSYYSMPHTHAGPFVIGLLCGYALAKRPKCKIPTMLKIIGWSTSIVSCLLVIYGSRKWNAAVPATFWETLFYASSYRVVWGLSVAWVITCCCTGNGGIADYILSSKVWVPLARLSFGAYLIHPVVMMVHALTQRSELIGDHRTAVFLYFAFLVLSYMFSFGCSMLIEAPFLSLEKVFFAKKKKEDSVDHSNENDENAKGVNGDIFLGKKSILPVLGNQEKDVEADNGVVNTAYVYKP